MVGGSPPMLFFFSSLGLLFSTVPCDLTYSCSGPLQTVTFNSCGIQKFPCSNPTFSYATINSTNYGVGLVTSIYDHARCFTMDSGQDFELLVYSSFYSRWMTSTSFVNMTTTNDDSKFYYQINGECGSFVNDLSYCHGQLAAVLSTGTELDSLCSYYSSSYTEYQVFT